MPTTWRMRAIRYQRRGFKPQLLLTSLLDPRRFPAAEIVALYHERWEIELGYNEVKRVMLAPRGDHAQQEPAGRRAGAVGPGARLQPRTLRSRARRRRGGVPPIRISFVAALSFIESRFRSWGTDSAGPPARTPRQPARRHRALRASRTTTSEATRAT